MYTKSLFFLLAITACTTPDMNKVEPSMNPSLKEGQVCSPEITRLKKQLPVYLPDDGVFITKLSHQCKKDSKPSAIAMGIPCEGSNGYVSFKGHFHRPKMVSFSLDVGCPNSRYTRDELERKIQAKFDIPDLRVIAINPLEIKYWEIPSIDTLGMGENVELRTNKSLELFKSMKDGDSLRVVLYGKENSWGKNQRIYKINAKIALNKSNPRRFALTVESGNALNFNQVESIKGKCKSNRYNLPCLLGFLKSNKRSVPTVKTSSPIEPAH